MYILILKMLFTALILSSYCALCMCNVVLRLASLIESLQRKGFSNVVLQFLFTVSDANFFVDGKHS